MVYSACMCGRFALGIPQKRLEEVFGVAAPGDWAPSWNVAPGREALTVTATDGVARADMRRFGLIPRWTKDAKIGHRMINARSETVFDKPAFRDPVRRSRCLVPVQAFYEWKKVDGGKRPYAIAVEGADAFALAGIASQWIDGRTGEVVDSFAVLTCEPNALVASIHDRMPVVLPPESWADWLDPSLDKGNRLSDLLAAYPADAMRAWPVTPEVGNARNDGPELLSPWNPPKQVALL